MCASLPTRFASFCLVFRNPQNGALHVAYKGQAQVVARELDRMKLKMPSIYQTFKEPQPNGGRKRRKSHQPKHEEAGVEDTAVEESEESDLDVQASDVDFLARAEQEDEPGYELAAAGARPSGTTALQVAMSRVAGFGSIRERHLVFMWYAPHLMAASKNASSKGKKASKPWAPSAAQRKTLIASALRAWKPPRERADRMEEQ